MKTKHTQGEWAHYYPSNMEPDTLTICIKNDPYLIAKVPIINKQLFEAEANAKLIAAAPELLNGNKKALEFISNWFHRIPSYAKSDANKIMMELENLIKKATP